MILAPGQDGSTNRYLDRPAVGTRAVTSSLGTRSRRSRPSGGTLTDVDDSLQQAQMSGTTTEIRTSPAAANAAAHQLLARARLVQCPTLAALRCRRRACAGLDLFGRCGRGGTGLGQRTARVTQYNPFWKLTRSSGGRALPIGGRHFGLRASDAYPMSFDGTTGASSGPPIRSALGAHDRES